MKQSTIDLFLGLARLREEANAQGNRLYRSTLVARHATGKRVLGTDEYRKAIVLLGEVTRKVNELRC